MAKRSAQKPTITRKTNAQGIRGGSKKMQPIKARSSRKMAGAGC